MNYKKGYFKVLKDEKVIDVLEEVFYLKYQPKHGIHVFCDENDAQGILSSDKNTIWHEETLYRMPVEGYDTVRLEKIDKYEYNQLKILNGKTPQEIIDSYTLELLEGGLL
jgi:hypothetical protein